MYKNRPFPPQPPVRSIWDEEVPPQAIEKEPARKISPFESKFHRGAPLSITRDKKTACLAYKKNVQKRSEPGKKERVCFSLLPEERKILDRLAATKQVTIGEFIRALIIKEEPLISIERSSPLYEEELNNKEEKWNGEIVPFSRKVSQLQIIRRWVWSRLCGFSEIHCPGTNQSLDVRQLYKRGQTFYGFKSTIIRGAAEAIGVYPDFKVPYKETPYYLKPYVQGWRQTDKSWAAIRNPCWIQNHLYWGLGPFDWKQATRNPREKKWIEFQTKRNLNEWGKGHGVSDELYKEFHYPRPELFKDGYKSGSIEYYIRRFFIENLVPRLKIDEMDEQGEDLFPWYQFEDVFTELNVSRERDGLPLIDREQFRVACYCFGFTTERCEVNEPAWRTHGLRPFLDVVDLVKIHIIESLKTLSNQRLFTVDEIWDAFEIKEWDFKERMLYDAALAELVYEGFLRSEKKYVVNDSYETIECYFKSEDFDSIDTRFLYLHTLNSAAKKFPQIKPMRYGKYIG